jgi:hypothetical protein
MTILPDYSKVQAYSGPNQILLPSVGSFSRTLKRFVCLEVADEALKVKAQFQ